MSLKSSRAILSLAAMAASGTLSVLSSDSAGAADAENPETCTTTSLEFAPDPVRMRVREQFEAAQFVQLESTLAKLSSGFPCSDRPLSIALDALRDGAPALSDRFNQWAASHSKSPHAQTMLAAHLGLLAAQARAPQPLADMGRGI